MTARHEDPVQPDAQKEKAISLPAHRAAHILGFLFLVTALSVAGTYWMVSTLRQAIQMELPVPMTGDAATKTIQS
jgi:hypothetical protein